MPVSWVQRMLRGHWSVVQDRAVAYAHCIPPEGVSRGRFVVDVLHDVDPQEADSVVELLGRRRIVWLSRYRGEVTVHGSRPKARVEKRLVGKRPIDSFVSGLAPLLLDAAGKVEAGRAQGAPPETREAARVAISRIITACEKKAASGLPLADMREAMWSTFADEVMRAVVRYEPRLQKQSESDGFAVERPRPKRLPRGSSPKQKALAIIERAGLDGITRSDIQKAIQPRMSAHDLAGVIGELGEEGAVVWGKKIRLHERARPGVRLFSAAVGLPVVRPDGTMRRRIEGEWYG